MKVAFLKMSRVWPWLTICSWPCMRTLEYTEKCSFSANALGYLLVTNGPNKTIFLPGNLFQIFASKARAYPRGAPFSLLGRLMTILLGYGQFYKSFYVHYLRMFVISYSIFALQALPT